MDFGCNFSLSITVSVIFYSVRFTLAGACLRSVGISLPVADLISGGAAAQARELGGTKKVCAAYPGGGFFIQTGDTDIISWTAGGFILIDIGPDDDAVGK